MSTTGRAVVYYISGMAEIITQGWNIRTTLQLINSYKDLLVSDSDLNSTVNPTESSNSVITTNKVDI